MGCFSAAYQIECGYNADGKGPSIWDVYSAKKGKIYKNQNAHISCDFYNRYTHDLILMHSLNIPNYRFSLSWSRIIPAETGNKNCKGLAYYHRLIDVCLELNIEPRITLYHWDLPHALDITQGS